MFTQRLSGRQWARQAPRYAGKRITWRLIPSQQTTAGPRQVAVGFTTVLTCEPNTMLNPNRVEDPEVASLNAELRRALSHLSPAPHHIDAGYTYFGQFIAHEIVAERHGGRTVTGRMELDSVYGDDVKPAPRTKEVLFEIKPSIEGGPDDLPRDAQGVAQIPEQRNDDNVIVAQFHLFWRRFHNYVIQNGCVKDPEDARRLVTQV